MSAAAKMGRRLSKESRHIPAPCTTHSSGVATRWTGTAVSSASRLASPRQHGAAAGQVDALVDDVLCELGRRFAEAADDSGHDQIDLLADRVSHLLGREDHRLRQTGRDLAPTHFRFHLVCERKRGADGQLELFAGPLPDGDAVLVTDVVLDGGVHVEATTADGVRGDDPTKGDDRGLGRSSPDVDHHVADRLVDVESGADGGGHRLLDEMRGGGAGTPGRLFHRTPLDRGDGRGDTDQDPRAVEPVDTSSPKEQPDHPLGDLEVGDRTLAERTDRHDVTGGTADHLPRLVADGEHFVRPRVERDDRRLVQDDALSSCVDEGVGRPEVDRQIPGHPVIVGPVHLRWRWATS